MAVVRQIGVSLSEYIKAVAVNAVVVAGLFMGGFALAGMPAWFAVGLLCGILNTLPYLGAILSLALAVLVALFFTHGWMVVIWSSVVWLAVQIIESFVLQPRAAGRSGVSPLYSIFLVLIAGFAFGPLGAILAVPVAAVILIVWRAMRNAER